MASDLQTRPGAERIHPEEPSLTSLVSGIISDIQTLFQQQLALFRSELREDLRRTRQALTMLGIGVAVALLAMPPLLIAISLGLVAAIEGLPTWAGFAITGGVLGLIGAVLIIAGIVKFRSFNPLPNETAEALKENVQCVIRTPK